MVILTILDVISLRYIDFQVVTTDTISTRNNMVTQSITSNQQQEKQQSHIINESLPSINQSHLINKTFF